MNKWLNTWFNQQINEKKYYIGSNGQFILEKKLSTNKKLPIIFGNFKVKNYLDLLSILESQNINSDLISKFYFHDTIYWVFFANFLYPFSSISWHIYAMFN